MTVLAGMFGLLYIGAFGLAWRCLGWAWALGILLGGPAVMVACAVLALVASFFLDIHQPQCARCAGPAPLQLRGTRYRRHYCDACARAVPREVWRI